MRLSPARSRPGGRPGPLEAMKVLDKMGKDLTAGREDCSDAVDEIGNQAQGLHIRADRRHRRGTTPRCREQRGGVRNGNMLRWLRAATLILLDLMASVHRTTAGVARWLWWAVAGSPDQVEIHVTALHVERRLTAWAVPWWPAMKVGAGAIVKWRPWPVAADVLGEGMEDMHQARDMASRRRAGWDLQKPRLCNLERNLIERTRDLGSARRAEALHIIEVMEWVFL